MIKQVILTFILFAGFLYAQLRHLDEIVNGNNYKIVLESNYDYSLKEIDGKTSLVFNSLFDESIAGNFYTPSSDIFIAIPKNSNPKIQFNSITKEVISALPLVNPLISRFDNNITYQYNLSPIELTEYAPFIVKGYLWIEDNYCLHLSINPFEIDYSSRTTVYHKKLEINLLVDEPWSNSAISNNREISNFIINKKFAGNFKSEYRNIEDKSSSWINFNQTYIKLGVASDGVYRVGYNELQNLGIQTSNIDPRKFQIFLKGAQIPIYVKGEDDQTFNQGDFVEFVGIRNMGGKHRELNEFGKPYTEYLDQYSDTTVYWLTWGVEDGLRVENSINASTTSSIDTIKYYHELIHYERNNWFDFSMADQVRRELPFWYENKTWHEGNLNVGTRNLTFSVSNVFPDRPLYLFSKQMSYASNITQNSHLLAIGLNNLPVQDSGFINKYQQKLLKGIYSSSSLANGNNTLKVISYPTTATLNACIYDWYEVEYPRYLRTYSDSLNFSFPYLDSIAKPGLMELTNVTNDSIVVWKYGNSYKRLLKQRNGTNVSLLDTLNNKTKYVLIKESKIRTPKIYYAKQFANLSSSDNRADYLAITNKRFLEGVNSYTNFIENHYGVQSKVIDVDDIYDQFNYGFFNPEAIKDFLKITHANWQSPKPKYVALIGGATYDYFGNKTKFQNAPPVYNYVPSFGASVSDNWFVTWDTTGAYLPQMNIGRIPVKTEAEFQNYFAKHLNYVNNPFNEWNKNFLFFSGGTSTDQNQLNQLREVNNFVINNYVTPAPTGGNSTHFYKTINPTTNFGPYTAEQIQQAIDAGAVFISYLGHSGTQTWDNSITQPAQLKNKVNRNPLITDFGCSTARFAEPDVTSFSQLFVLSNEGQAIAYIGNSSLGFLSTSTMAPKLFYKKVLQDSVYNISEALKLAKIEMLQTYGSSGVYQLFALTNTLIGDPIINLAIPPKPNLSLSSSKINLSIATPTDDLDSITINLNYLNTGKVTADSFTVKVYDDYSDSTKLIFETRRILPKYLDSLAFTLGIKNKPGIHRLSISLDYLNEIDEITKGDNQLIYNLSVASTSLRTTLIHEIENGSDDSIYFLNPVGKPSSDTLIVQVSNNSNFDFANAVQIRFDTLFTKLNLPGLSFGNRYWIRSRVKGSESYGRANSFLLGGTRNFLLADKFSYLNSKLTNIEYKDNKITLSSEENVIYAMSAGFHDGRSVVISLNEQNFIPENTLRGHHVCLFTDTFEFVLYKRFDTYSGGTNVTNYITFLDTLSSDYYVAIAISDEGSVSSVPLKNQLKSIGSKYIDSLVFRGSWAIIGKKGAPPGSVPEAFTKPYGGRADVDTTFYKRYNSGSLLTSQIGPVDKWIDVQIEETLESNSSIAYRPLGIKNSGEIDTLNYLTFVNNSASLENINADFYPNIKLLAEFNASSDSISPSLKSLSVNYRRLPELAMNYQTVYANKDSIVIGDSITFTATVMNVGESTAENFNMIFELVRPDNTKRIVLSKEFQELHPFEKRSSQFTLRTSRWEGLGEFKLNVLVDTANNVKELYKDNNSYQLNFRIKADTVTSITQSAVALLVNSKEIFDGDFVPANPNLQVEMKYPTWFEIEDTSSIQFFLNETRLNYGDFNSVQFDTVNRTLSYSFNKSLADGEYTFKIFAKDVSGLITNTPAFERNFVVYNDLKIAQVYNYPNPFTETTNFTFKLTQVPDEVVIKVYTIAGRLIREIKKNSSELNADFNFIQWDGRDQDGDKIANGVYLYKVIARLGDKTEHITEKLAKIR
ncbi:MAG: T9SS type A sorting domain-containing protein [Ignavibacteriaceae bacterium]|nr:T9SS type A sorting domain-containing protein [Ignavibacteriaceae bacterium]